MWVLLGIGSLACSWAYLQLFRLEAAQLAAGDKS
jgi:hypothetical protein